MSLIIIPSALEREIKQTFDTNYEVGCFFLAVKEPDALVITEHLFVPFSESSVSPLFLNQVPDSFLKAPEDRYELLTGHMHARKYGEQIEKFDPYWTIGQNPLLYTPGDIVDGKFYVTKKALSQGDSDGLKRWCEYFKQTRSKVVDKTIFIHPHYGSEGTLMTPELVAITTYHYDPTLPFNIKEIPITIQ